MTSITQARRSIGIAARAAMNWMRWRGISWTPEPSTPMASDIPQKLLGAPSQIFRRRSNETVLEPWPEGHKRLHASTRAEQDQTTIAQSAVKPFVTEKLQAQIRFYQAEMNLFRAGTENYLVMLATKASNDLDAIGGIRPYEFLCRPADGNVVPHTFIGREP